MRNFTEITDLSPNELRVVLDYGVQHDLPRLLDGEGAALIFQKPSARTRNSMEMAVTQLGGHPVTIRGDEIDLGVRETVEDVARTLSCYHRVIAARVFDHEVIEKLGAAATVPVVNLLSDRGHPVQALADMLTIEAEFGSVANKTVTYVGDPNNVAFSLGLAVLTLGGSFRVAHPHHYGFSESQLRDLQAVGDVQFGTDPKELLVDADVVYTDVWTSMGQEDERQQRLLDFDGFCLTPDLMAAAKPTAIVLHCLPAHRGEEIAHEVLEGPQSRVWTQAENRLHSVRGLLYWMLLQPENVLIRPGESERGHG